MLLLMAPTEHTLPETCFSAMGACLALPQMEGRRSSEPYIKSGDEPPLETSLPLTSLAPRHKVSAPVVARSLYAPRSPIPCFDASLQFTGLRFCVEESLAAGLPVVESGKHCSRRSGIYPDRQGYRLCGGRSGEMEWRPAQHQVCELI